MGESAIMSLVHKEGAWRVRIVWPKRQRYFGRFASKAEAQRWLTEHQRMINRPTEGEEKGLK
jgi:hypothetical protein